MRDLRDYSCSVVRGSFSQRPRDLERWVALLSRPGRCHQGNDVVAPRGCCDTLAAPCASDPRCSRRLGRRAQARRPVRLAWRRPRVARGGSRARRRGGGGSGSPLGVPLGGGGPGGDPRRGRAGGVRAQSPSDGGGARAAQGDPCAEQGGVQLVLCSLARRRPGAGRQRRSPAPPRRHPAARRHCCRSPWGRGFGLERAAAERGLRGGCEACVALSAGRSVVGDGGGGRRGGVGGRRRGGGPASQVRRGRAAGVQPARRGRGGEEGVAAEAGRADLAALAPCRTPRRPSP